MGDVCEDNSDTPVNYRRIRLASSESSSFEFKQLVRDSGLLFRETWRPLLLTWLAAQFLIIAFNNLVLHFLPSEVLRPLFALSDLYFFIFIWLRDGFYSIYAAFIVVCLFQRLRDPETSITSGLRRGFQVLPAIYAATLVHSAVVYLGYYAHLSWGLELNRSLWGLSGGTILLVIFYLFLIPGMIIKYLTIFYPQLIVFRDKNPLNAVVGSLRIVMPHWWKVFVAYLLLIGHELPALAVSAVIPEGIPASVYMLVVNPILALFGYVFATVLFLHLSSMHKNTLPVEINCPRCKAVLELDESERLSGPADCPNCEEQFRWSEL